MMDLISGAFIENVMKQLPVATEFDLHIGDGTKLLKDKAIFVDGKELTTVGKGYQLVQHEAAFRPIIQGLDAANVRGWDFMAIASPKKVRLNIYVASANDGAKGIRFGFQIMNSFDGRSAIKFDMKGTKTIHELVQVNKRVVTLWGFRLACQNGMIVKVPLEYHDIVVPEVRTRVETLLKESARIVHNAKAEDKLKMVGYVVEAFTLLQRPMERMIELGKSITIADMDTAKELVKKYIGQKYLGQITNRWNLHEDRTLWGLYNAATHYASHQGAVRSQIPLMEKSATMFEREIVARQPAGA